MIQNCDDLSLVLDSAMSSRCTLCVYFSIALDQLQENLNASLYMQSFSLFKTELPRRQF